MKDTVLVDINVLLDVLARREPHFAASVRIWDAVETRVIQGVVSANSITTLYYLLCKVANHDVALRGIRLMSEIFAILPVDRALIEQAMNSDIADFEDAVQYESALGAKVTAIITRDVRHFKNAAISVLSPEVFLARLQRVHPEAI